MTVVYEWDTETVSALDTPDLEFGEVIDHRHASSFAEAKAAASTTPPDGCAFEVVLVRDDDAGRAWAYLEADGTLPSHFADAEGHLVARVPQRFVREVDKTTRSAS